MKTKNITSLIIAGLLAIFLLSGFTKSTKNIRSQNQLLVKFSGAVRDTVYLFNGRNINSFKLILRNPKANKKHLYKIEGNTLVLNTHQVGYLRTKIKYQHFALHTEWAWTNPHENGNSGVLVYLKKPDVVWPKCIQINLKNQHTGDFIAMNGAMFPQAEGKPNGVVPKFKKSSERPIGQWNECDVICKGDSIMVYVNGVFQNKATHVTLKNGYIGFQLEGYPIKFRNIYLVKE